jgi:hypothetical protein
MNDERSCPGCKHLSAELVKARAMVASKDTCSTCEDWTLANGRAYVCSKCKAKASAPTQTDTAAWKALRAANDLISEFNSYSTGCSCLAEEDVAELFGKYTEALEAAESEAPKDTDLTEIRARFEQNAKGYRVGWSEVDGFGLIGDRKSGGKVDPKDYEQVISALLCCTEDIPNLLERLRHADSIYGSAVKGRQDFRQALREQRALNDKLILVLKMIREGAGDPRKFAADTIAEVAPADTDLTKGK